VVSVSNPKSRNAHGDGKDEMLSKNGREVAIENKIEIELGNSDIRRHPQPEMRSLYD
jgi:hypothetical protein